MIKIITIVWAHGGICGEEIQFYGVRILIGNISMSYGGDDFLIIPRAALIKC